MLSALSAEHSSGRWAAPPLHSCAAQRTQELEPQHQGKPSHDFTRTHARACLPCFPAAHPRAAPDSGVVVFDLVFAIIDFVFFRLHLCGGGALNTTVLSSFHPVWRARPFREVVIVRRGALTFCGRPSRA